MIIRKSCPRGKCRCHKKVERVEKRKKLPDGSHIAVYGFGLHPAGNLRPGETQIGNIIYSDSPNVLLGMQFSIRRVR